MHKLSSMALLSLFSFSAISGANLGIHENQSYPKLETVGLTQLDTLPSASASVFVNNQFYVVGDDSPNLYRLNEQFDVEHKTDIQNGQPGDDGRIAGNQKADLEGAEYFVVNEAPTLVMLGSGTYTDTREKALLYSLKDHAIQWHNMKPLYRSLRKVANLKKTEFINIEGLASNGETVFLLSRGNHGPNLIFTFNQLDFLNYITGKVEHIDNVGVQKVSLSAIDGVEATLSGAAWHAPSQRLIITTSVDDDEKGILGSFVSYIEHNELLLGGKSKGQSELHAVPKGKQTIDLAHRAFLIHHDGKPLTSKVESVVITQTQGKTLEGVITADNDDGTSQFARFSTAF